MSAAPVRKPDPTDADGNRDRRFFPADARRAATLTEEQIDHYNQQGYVSGIDVFDDRSRRQQRR